MKNGPPIKQTYGKVNQSLEAARQMAPFLVDILHPRSVVDLGCSVGYWLSVFREQHIEDVVGYDGPWVDTRQLLIPQACFRAVDLNKPLAADRRFDLALCLEVGEHLQPAKAGELVDELTRLAPAVLFSAAIPGQGGTDHINEQWPDFWIEHFARHGFAAVDCIRPRFWNNPKVYYYYAQNTFLFADENLLRENPRLRELKTRYAELPPSMVHPALFARKMEKLRDRTFPGSLWKLGRRLRALFPGAPPVRKRYPLPPSAQTRG